MSQQTPCYFEFCVVIWFCLTCFCFVVFSGQVSSIQVWGRFPTLRLTCATHFAIVFFATMGIMCHFTLGVVKTFLCISYCLCVKKRKRKRKSKKLLCGWLCVSYIVTVVWISLACSTCWTYHVIWNLNLLTLFWIREISNVWVDHHKHISIESMRYETSCLTKQWVLT